MALEKLEAAEHWLKEQRQLLTWVWNRFLCPEGPAFPFHGKISHSCFCRFVLYRMRHVIVANLVSVKEVQRNTSELQLLNFECLQSQRNSLLLEGDPKIRKKKKKEAWISKLCLSFVVNVWFWADQAYDDKMNVLTWWWIIIIQTYSEIIWGQFVEDHWVLHTDTTTLLITVVDICKEKVHEWILITHKELARVFGCRRVLLNCLHPPLTCCKYCSREEQGLMDNFLLSKKNAESLRVCYHFDISFS